MGQKMAPIRIEIQDEKSVPRWYTIVTKFNYEQKFATDLEKGIVNKIILPKSLENLLKKSTKHREAVEDDYKNRRIKILLFFYLLYWLYINGIV